MRKRIILFCITVIITMVGMRAVVEKMTERDRNRRPSRNDYRITERLPEPTPPPWVETEPPTPPPGLFPPSTPDLTEETPAVDLPTLDPVETAVVEETASPEVLELPPGIDASTIEGDDEPGLADETALVINEIMFHPRPVSEREPIDQEYIELFNPSQETIELEGYRITSGVNYTFPKTSLAPGGYLVVAANISTFQTVYNRQASVVGPWAGRLSNGAEEITLEDADGKVVDRVDYADQGDWAIRTLTDRVPMSHRSNFSGHRSYSRGEFGWTWQNAADGEGSSLELISHKMSNNHGSNWSPSRQRGGTPGMPNSAQSTNVAPLISGLKHRPAVPQPNQKVLILAEIDDETQGTITAVAHWRVSNYRGRSPFQQAPMQRLSGDRFAAVIPGHPDKTVIEFYVSASDGKQQRQWPATTNPAQRANPLYQVDSETNRTAMAFYRLIMTEEENQRFGDNRHSNAEKNTTLIADDGSGPIIRYLCGTRVRGAGSRHNRPPPMRVNLPRDKPWNGGTRMNLNSVYPWLQYVGMKVFQASKLPAPNMLPVQVRRNGRDVTRKSSKDYGAFVHAQPLDGNFIDEHYSDDDGGNLYKKVRPDNDWSWHDGYVSGYQSDGWLKQTNSADNDWNDLDQFLGVMNNATRDRDYLQQVAKVMDVDQWLRYLAIMALLNNGEGGIANGIDDDYAMYRGTKDTRFQALPHDLDTILGVGESSSNPQRTLFDFAEKGNELEPLEDLFREPEIRKRYYAIMADLIQTSFATKTFDRLLEDNLTGWVPQSTIRRMQNFMALRVNFAAQEIRRNIGKPSKLPAPKSVSALRVKPSKGVIINEILATNAAAHPHGETFPDAIELHNPGQTAVSLAGLSLTDDIEKPGKFIFPDGATIDPNAYLVVYADALSVEGELHTGFALKQEGETLTLFDKAVGEAPREELDSIAFGPQIPDHSIGRRSDRPDTWTLTQPSLGAANTPPVSTGSPAAVRINEWLGAPEARFANDFVELLNTSDQPVGLGGLALTNNYVSVPETHRLPTLSFIGAKGYALFESLGKKSKQQSPSDLPFRLASHHGWLRIVDGNDIEIDKVHYVCQRPDIAQGRLPNGSTNIAYLTVPTPGAPNGAAKDTSSAVRSLILGLRVSELMYHPINPDLEYVELVNIFPEPINLTGVRFTNGIEFIFVEGSLEPGARLVLTNNRAAFTAEYGEDIAVGGEYSGKLSNGGEVLELSLPKPANMAIQRFKYDDKWYASTDGEGHSLVVLDTAADVKRWEDLSNWRPSEAVGGSPGS